MKNKKTNKYYKKIKDGFIASAGGGLVAGMIFISSANAVYADTAPVPSYTKSLNTTGMHVMHRWNSKPKIDALVSTLGLDSATVDSELKSGKSLKQILVDNGLDTSVLDKALNGKQRHKSWKKHQIN